MTATPAERSALVGRTAAGLRSRRAGFGRRNRVFAPRPDCSRRSSPLSPYSDAQRCGGGCPTDLFHLEIATPWLTAAIEENFGTSRSVEVGGTQIERTENGRTAVRIRDIVVRDTDGTIVASAPKAEVGVSGASLLSGHVRAESLNLVGAEMAVRIKPDGDVTVFAGGNKRPIATASVPAAASSGGASAAQQIASSMAPPDWRRLQPFRRLACRPPSRASRRMRSRHCCHGSTASARPASTATSCARSD